MTAIFFFIDALLGAYALAIIISIIISWLVSFGIINSYQPFVQAVSRTLYAITEPALSRIRRFLPDLGGIDISPLILYFAVYAVRVLLRNDIAPLFGIYGY